MAEIAKCNYPLPSNFDPVIFAFIEAREYDPKLEKEDSWLEWRLGFFYNMKKVKAPLK